MEYRELGTSEIDVSRIAMGLWAISEDDTWGPQDEAQSIDAIHAAIDEGITYFDTAEAYGRGYSEEVLGKAIDGYDREDLVLSTKVWRANLRPADLREACTASLERIGTDYIDVYHVHWPNHDLPLEETIDTLRELREEGTIRTVAVSNFGQADLTDLLELERPVTNQLPYSLLWRAIEHDIRDLCLDHDVGITAYSPLAQGLLVGRWDTPEDVPEGRAQTRWYSSDRPATDHDEPGVEAETFEAIDEIRGICADAGVSTVHAALAWVLSRPGVDTVLVGGRSPEEIRDSARAVDLELGSDMLEELTRVTDELKETLGPNPDMWLSDSRYR